MKDKKDIGKLGKIVEDAKETLEGKDSKQKRSTKRIISKMSM